MAACRNIEIELSIEFLNGGEQIPSSWIEFPFVQRISDNPKSGDLETIKWTNALAIVPGVPVIESLQGIQHLRQGKRLFAISRTKNQWSDPATDESPIGRCAILISKDGSTASSSWIPEEEAQIILSRLNDFEPSAQPLAFGNVETLTSDEATSQQRDMRVIQQHYKNGIKHREKDNRAGPTAKKIESRWIHWVIGSIFIVIVIIIVWQLSRKQ